MLTTAVGIFISFESATVFARGFGGGGGGRAGGGGASFSRPSGGGGSRNFSAPGGSQGFSRPSDGQGSWSSGGVSSNTSRPSQQPPGTGGRIGAGPALRPSGVDRPSAGNLPTGSNGLSQIPSANRTSPGGAASRPGAISSGRPGPGDVGNFLGVAGGAAAGGALGSAIANRPSQLSAEHPGLAGANSPAGLASRPDQRPNWNARSANRNAQWQQRVSNRHEAWNQRIGNRQEAGKEFQANRNQRWNNLENARNDRQNWRNEKSADWQKHRQELWNYRGDRAEEVWDQTRDFYDDIFDDRWWGDRRWGYGWAGQYPANPWWWWVHGAWNTAARFVGVIASGPIYIDYGMNVNYEGDTVYVDEQPVSATQYTQPMIDLAVYAEQPPPPLPPTSAQAQAEEWLPLGVYALAQEEKGEPILFFQISVNRAGRISGAYNSTLTADQRPIAGQVDKSSQRVAWRIGANTDTIFESSLANLTQDVSPVAIHFGANRTQTWLLIRLPEPAQPGEPQNLPEASKTPPPLDTAK